MQHFYGVFLVLLFLVFGGSLAAQEQAPEKKEAIQQERGDQPSEALPEVDGQEQKARQENDLPAEQGNGEVKEVKGARPQINIERKGARPEIERPAGVGRPAGAGRPGGAARPERPSRPERPERPNRR